MRALLVLGLYVPLFLLASCDTGNVNNGPDLRPVPDLRTSPGNVAVGAVCDDTNPCPKDKAGTATRCAVIETGDPVGVCAPSCTSNLDCDTALPGSAFCTDMPMLGAASSECVLFCGIKNKECPRGWSCVGVQTYFVCKPPQTKPNPDMM